MKNLSICLFVIGLAVLGCESKPPAKTAPLTAPSGAAMLSHAPGAAEKKDDAPAAEKKDDAPAAEKKDEKSPCQKSLENRRRFREAICLPTNPS